MRPLNLLQGAIAIFVCATLMDLFPEWREIVLAILIVWTYTGAGNSLNDYYDSEIDRINRPNRPIPSGLIKRSTALYYSVILFIIGSLLSVFIFSIDVLIVLIIAMFFLITYSRFFKPSPLWGNVVVSLILGMAFIFGSVIFKDIYKGIPPALLAFGFTLIRELIKDMQDIEGDRSVGANTFPIKYGLVTSKHLVTIMILVLMTGAFSPFFLSIYGKYYLVTLVLTVEIPLLFVIFSIQRDHSSKNCSRLSSILKGDIFFGLLAIYLGKF